MVAKRVNREPVVKSQAVCKLLMVGLSALPLGCSDEDSVDATSACAETDFRVCDVTEPSCHQSVFEQVLCVRGISEQVLVMPPVRVVPRRTLPGQSLPTADAGALQQDAGIAPPVDPDGGPGSRASSAEATPLELPALSTSLREEVRQGVARGAELSDEVNGELAIRALGLMGLVDSSHFTQQARESAQWEAVAGYYDSEQQEIVVVANSEDDTSTISLVVTLAHEMVHAIQDQSFGLRSYRSAVVDSTDTLFGSLSVTEGEATLFHFFVEQHLREQNLSEEDWSRFFSGLTEFADEHFSEAASPFVSASQVFPYTYGANLAFERAGDGLTGLATLREQRPTTFEAIAERFSEPAARSRPLEGIETPEGLYHLSTDSLGAWLMHGFLLRRASISARPKLVLDWEWDQVDFYVTPQAEIGLVWRTVWKDSSSAQTFEAALDDLEQGVGRWQVRREGEQVTLIGAERSVSVLELLADAVAAVSSLDADGRSLASVPGSPEVGSAALRDAILRTFATQSGRGCAAGERLSAFPHPGED